MPKLTKEEIAEAFKSKNSDNYKKLINFCKEPKTYSQMGKAGIKGDVFKILVDLKKIGALSWADGKYFSTKEAIEILNYS